MATTFGQRFGRYELLEHIDSGGMGEVYRARDHDLHRDVAVKFLPERFASDARRLARFAQEARTASSLNHPNIVTIHEIGERDGRPYIVMEYVEGKTLRRLLQHGRPLAAKQTLDIAIQLADGLAKAHAARIVHRDLKPENVMVTNDGFVKILDFGLAKLRAEAEEAFEARSTPSDTVTGVPRTGAGVLLGTAAYMAPEQARGLPADHRSDQFALGAMLYEMATGRRAFHGDSVVQTLSAIIDTEPQSIAEVNPSFPPPARWAIERCLAKDPAQRYASTLDLAHELRGIRERIGETTASGSGPISRVPTLRRSRQLRVAIGIAGVVVIVFLTPGIRESVLRRFWPALLLPADIRLALLFDDDGLPAQDRAQLQSLPDYVVIRLAELNRFRESFSVVPLSEMRDAAVRSPHDAKRRVGANVAMSLTVRRVEQSLVVSASLEDAGRSRVLGGDQRTFAASQFSEDAVVDLITSVLRIELPPDARHAWVSGSSDVAEARTLFANGLMQTPYQNARTALDRYDQQQSLEAAIDSFNRAIELDPRYADARAKLGEAYLRLYRLTNRAGDIALAEQNATKARELDQTRPSAWITLGMIHAQRGALAEAEQDFGNAIARAPSSSLAYRELALAEERGRQPDKALAHYRKAIELDPQDWSNYSYLGSFLYYSRRYSEAEQVFLTAAGKAPDNARIWTNLGAAYADDHRPEEAEKALDHAISLYEYGPALSNLATLKFRDAKYTDAALLSERAVRASPRDYRVWKTLAAAYYWMPGARDRAAVPQRQAVKILKEELTIEPDNPTLLAELADSYAVLGDARQARALIDRALKLASPPSLRVVELAAFVHETLGDRPAALRYVAAALGAGASSNDIEKSPTLADLTRDPRYAKLKSR